jgi:ParB family chromosome partitioning protein
LTRRRVKDTRAAVVTEAAGSTYIHPAALFALSQAEIALPQPQQQTQPLAA